MATSLKNQKQKSITKVEVVDDRCRTGTAMNMYA